jgi:hypothetical protein
MVMSRGQIIRELPRSELSEQRIIEAIVGGLNVGSRRRSTSPTLTIAEQAEAKWGKSDTEIR